MFNTCLGVAVGVTLHQVAFCSLYDAYVCTCMYNYVVQFLVCTTVLRRMHIQEVNCSLEYY